MYTDENLRVEGSFAESCQVSELSEQISRSGVYFIFLSPRGLARLRFNGRKTESLITLHNGSLNLFIFFFFPFLGPRRFSRGSQYGGGKLPD